MNMFKKAALGFVIAISVAASASAADMPRKASPYVAPPQFSWTGFYVGGFGGYSSGKVSDVLGPVGGFYSVSPKGGVFGVHAGYDWQLPNRIVLGLRVAVPVFGAGSDSVPDPLLPTVSYEGKVKGAVLGTAHIGYAFDRFLPYVGGGLAIGRGEATLVNLTPGTGITPGTRLSDTQTHVGYTLLAGVRYALTDHWWVAVQYNYLNLGSQTYSWVPGTGSRDIDFRSNAVTGIISYKF